MTPLLTIGLILSLLPTGVPVELRQPDVLYFEGTLDEEIVLKLDEGVHAHLDRSLSSINSVFYAGQEVIVLAYDPKGDAFLLEGQYRNAPTQGWVPATKLQPPVPPELIDEAEARRKELEAIERAVKERLVIPGMTFDHVRKSQGKPDAYSNRADKRGRVDLWTYIRYEKIYEERVTRDYYGRTLIRRVPIRVPVGEFSVEFVNGRVVAVEEHETSTRRSVNPPRNSPVFE